MRKILGLFLLCLALSACEFEFSGNGNLDGYWQLTTVDTLSTGGLKNMHESKIYWAVQNDLLEVKYVYEFGILFRFAHSNGILKLWDPYAIDRDSGDVKIVDVAKVQPMGVNSLEETYEVLQLDKEKMILQSQMLRLYFRKY